MPDRHKIKPMSLRIPEALSAWLAREAARRNMPVRTLMIEILQAAVVHQHHPGGSCWPTDLQSTPADRDWEG